MEQIARRASSAWLKLAVIPLAGLLVACNGSSDDDADTTTVSGSVVAAPVAGASVVAKDVSGNRIAGPVTTGSDGSYSLEIPDSNLSSAIIFESMGGSFDDEASGDTGITAGALAAQVAGGSLSAGSAVHMTPASTIVRGLVSQHGKTLSEAKTAFESAFGFAVDSSIAPADATATPAVGVTQAQLLAGLRAAVFSQMTMDLGLTSAQQFDLLSALAQDLSDGTLDGEDVTGAVTITGSNMLPADTSNRFSQAMVNFREGGNDETGLANTEIGTLPFAKLALSSSYRVEYVPNPMMGAMEGKTMFTLNISDASGNPVSEMVSLMPMMHMATMNHASPVDGCSETATAGEYACTLYYLMGSSMMNGMSMGYWQLKVMVGGMMGESVTFSPSVMMAMGDTAKATLKGQSGDQIAGMMMPEKRSYYLFKDALTGMTGNHTFNLFVAARESMMSFPAVSLDTVLSTGTAYELTANPMTVEVSSDASTWIVATDNGSGHWSTTGIAGLVDDVPGTIYVRLTINSEQKTTDGTTPAGDGTNDYAQFTVTPGGM